MTTAAPPPPTPKADNGFDPDSYRMTIGDHLEELRHRFVWGLAGFAVVLIICLAVGKDQLFVFFCRPLLEAQQSYDINTQLQEQTPGAVFMVYLKMCLITAAAFSAPWTLFQLWRFVAAGLYPHERKYVTRYIPLSLGLLITGMVFVYYVVLPWTLQFFIAFAIGVKMPDLGAPDKGPTTQAVSAATYIQMLDADPEKPQEGQIWYERQQKRLRLRLGGETRNISISPSNLISIEYTLPEYVDLVLVMLISFGLSFQLPLVVLALARIGIVEIDTLRASRKYVYFILVIAAAVITPGADLPSLVALSVPLCLLYELGIWLARLGGDKKIATGTE
jgi:sec-independent protein translocase protein TatC